MLKEQLYTRISVRRLHVCLLILRVALGVLMAYHGFGKLINYDEKAAKFMSFMGMGGPISLALLIFAEFFCSIFLAIGLLTRYALIPLILAMGVAAFDAHEGEIFGEGEHSFMYMVCYLVLFIAGPGKYSIDNYLVKQKK